MYTKAVGRYLSSKQISPLLNVAIILPATGAALSKAQPICKSRTPLENISLLENKVLQIPSSIGGQENLFVTLIRALFNLYCYLWQ